MLISLDLSHLTINCVSSLSLFEVCNLSSSTYSIQISIALIDLLRVLINWEDFLFSTKAEAGVVLFISTFFIHFSLLIFENLAMHVKPLVNTLVD